MKSTLALFLISTLLLFKILLAEDVSNEVNESVSEELEAVGRIFGGLKTRRNDYNYVARLDIFFSKGWSRVRCSGVVLDQKIILTVAHCVTRQGQVKAERVVAKLSTSIFSYTFRQNEILIHPGFSNGDYRSDVAILRLSNARASSFIKNFGQPPRLPPQISENSNLPAEGSNVTTVGWGLKEGQNTYPNLKPQYAFVRILNSATCKSTNPAFQRMNENELLCTFDNVAGLCSGDWGGPLLLGNSNEEKTVIGLNMYHAGDCRSSQGPSAYFNLGTVSDWIMNSR